MRPRFGLRTLMIVSSLLCVLLGTQGRWWLEDRRQEARLDQCEKMLASEGRVFLSRDDQQNAYFVFYGQLSPASARALCKADYVRCININDQTDGALPAETAAVLRQVFVQPDPPSIAPGMWARPDDAGFVRFVEDRGGTAPSAPARQGEP